MSLTKNRLYLLLITACFTGYIWLFYNFFSERNNQHTFETCVIKKVTTIPCPSCGSTRSMVSLLHGHLTESLLINPLGILIALIMVICPVWILIDVIRKSNSLYLFYLKSETFLKKTYIALPLILLLIINWIWNIYKGV